MRATRNELHNDVDLAALPAVIKRSLKPLGIASAVVGILTYAGLMLVPSRYSSEAQIRIGAERNTGGPAENAALQVDREAIQSRVQELRSPDLARQLAGELKLNLLPEFNSALDNQGIVGSFMRLAGIGGPRPGETEEERVLSAYYRALQVYQVKDTRVITLGFTARDGELAATAANRLVDLYQQWLRQQGASETTDANAWLAPEIEKRTRELSLAEADVERFRSQANLFVGGGSQPSGIAEQQLTELATELTRARAQRGEAEARARAAREMMNRGIPDAITDVQKSPVIQGLIAQRVRAERDLAEASTQLLPAHPRMKQLYANVADIRRQVQREAISIVDGLEREVKVLALREDLAQRALEEAKTRVGDKAGDRVRLASLEDEARAKRRELEALRNRFEAARTRGTTRATPVEVQVIATARATTKPSWPNRIQIASLAAAATFVLGLVVVLFRELLGGGARQARAVEARAPSPTRSAAPATVGTIDGAPAEVTSPTAASSAGGHRPQSAKLNPGAGGVTRLAGIADVVNRLVGNSAGQGGYRTVVVGASDDIDVREEAADIAAGLSAAGRQVVLVDWSPDGDGIAEALGVGANPGFNDLLAGTHTFDDVLRVLPDGDFHFVPCGTAGPLKAGALDADKLNLLLDALDEAYADVVVTGSYSAVRRLFQAIEGRFDAGVVVGGKEPAAAGGGLLGFDVTDIDIIGIERLHAGPARRRPVRTRLDRGTASGVATAPAS
ncbi:MAG: exopolysaccharide transport family protein [Hyphomicrobiaceae bacterium]|nr:exopolysaccharide transport family protein [Hyphomicrobiaceae bacterium]